MTTSCIKKALWEWSTQCSHQISTKVVGLQVMCISSEVTNIFGHYSHFGQQKKNCIHTWKIPQGLKGSCDPGWHYEFHKEILPPNLPRNEDCRWILSQDTVFQWWSGFLLYWELKREFYVQTVLHGGTVHNSSTRVWIIIVGWQYSLSQCSFFWSDTTALPKNRTIFKKLCWNKLYSILKSLISKYHALGTLLLICMEGANN